MKFDKPKTVPELFWELKIIPYIVTDNLNYVDYA
jgi:hypothetical protein